MFRARLAELNLGPVAIHAAYLVNLAGPSEDLFERSIGVLARELEVAPAYGARFVNVHVGSHRGAGVAAGIERIADGVARVFEPRELAVHGGNIEEDGVDAGSPSVTLTLENSAGSGDGLGTTIDELARILEAIAARGVPDARVGICLDTAHLWGAGRDISTIAGVDELVDEVAGRIGLARLSMIHLNDSRAVLGSRADRHQHVGAGLIGPEGLARLLVHPSLRHVAYFVETPGMDEGFDAVNVDRARSLARGIPLAQLSPESLAMSGSRARAAAPP